MAKTSKKSPKKPLKKTSGKTSKKKSRPVESEEYDNTNRGVLFSNKKYKKKKSHPDMKGNFTDSNGVEFWLAAWFHEDKNGNKYLSLAATEKEAEEEEEEDEIEEEEQEEEDEDDLPF